MWLLLWDINGQNSVVLVLLTINYCNLCFAHVIIIENLANFNPVDCKLPAKTAQVISLEIFGVCSNASTVV